MKKQLLHTPDGVRDIYREECVKKLTVEKEIRKVFRTYGYEEIETPTFEFFDIFTKERGSVTTQEMFKFFDRDNNTLVLRPDVTPAIARCVAKYFMDEDTPLRLCYLAKTFINNSSYQGRLKEMTHTGAEMVGEDSAAGDAEMIAMVVEALKSSGLKEFQVELGQVEFFRGLADEAGMDEETQENLRELIENKNIFGVEELMKTHPMQEHVRKVLMELPQLFGSLSDILKIKDMVKNERAIKAIDRLEQVNEILKLYGLEDYVSYDLGMLSKYKYYTGIIFKAYTYGTGDYLVTGGRYDKLLVQFGKDTPAVGFAIVVERLMQALDRQNIQIPVKTVNTAVIYRQEDFKQALKLAASLRSQGEAVQLIQRNLEKTEEDYCRSFMKGPVRRLFVVEKGGETVREVYISEGQEEKK